MFDLNKQFPPPAIEQENLLFQVSRHGFVTSLDQEVACIVHFQVLLYPVWKIPKEILKKHDPVIEGF